MGFDHTKRHRRCADANLPSFVLLSGVIGATLARAFAPTLALTLAFVLLGKGKDTDFDVDHSSIGVRRSLSISDFRLWTTTPGDRSDPQIRKGKEKGEGRGEEDHARVVE